MTEGKRFSAEDMKDMAGLIGWDQLHPDDIRNRSARMLEQAARTEAMVAELVESMEAIAASWDSDGRIPLDEDEYSAGRRQVGERVAEEIREALSKSRGE